MPQIRSPFKSPEEAKLHTQYMDKLRQRRFRKRKKLLARKARLEAKMEIVAAKLKAAQENILKQQWHLRKHATANDGWVTGWNATAPLTEAELKALSYAKRYIEKYVEAVVKKQQWLESMAAQQAPKPHVVPIAL